MAYRFFGRGIFVKMANVWAQQFKDAIYAAEQFFNEKKPGQYPADVVIVQQFAAVVLRNNVEDQLGEQFRTILSNPQYITLMSKGLMIKIANKLAPGEFFPKSGVIIVIKHDGAMFSLNIRDMLSAISNHGKRTDTGLKANIINLYIINMLSQAFCTYITQIGHSFMEKKDRESIIGHTAVEPMGAPYSYGQRMQAMKNVINDGLKTPMVEGFVKKNLGDNMSRVISTAVTNFELASIGDLQGGLEKALATQKAGPIIEAITNMVTATAGNMHAKDGVDASEQD